MSNKNRVMVSVPKALKERLDRLAGELMASYEKGIGNQDLELTDQGSRGTWVPLHVLISKALDELEDHKKRSKASRSRKTQETPCVNSGE